MEDIARFVFGLVDSVRRIVSPSAVDSTDSAGDSGKRKTIIYGNKNYDSR